MLIFKCVELADVRQRQNSNTWKYDFMMWINIGTCEFQLDMDMQLIYFGGTRVAWSCLPKITSNIRYFFFFSFRKSLTTNWYNVNLMSTNLIFFTSRLWLNDAFCFEFKKAKEIPFRMLLLLRCKCICES